MNFLKKVKNELRPKLNDAGCISIANGGFFFILKARSRLGHYRKSLFQTKVFYRDEKKWSRMVLKWPTMLHDHPTEGLQYSQPLLLQKHLIVSSRGPLKRFLVVRSYDR